jgi:3-phytase
MLQLTTKFAFSVAVISFIAACSTNQKSESIPNVSAAAETSPAKAVLDDDAADDPAIWVHPTDIEQSIIIGTNKKLGLETYKLNGERLAIYPEGRMNNVDVQYGFAMGAEEIDIAAASNRSTNTLDVWQIKPGGELIKLKTAGDSSLLPEVYGFCLAKFNNTFYAFVSDKTGAIEQWSFVFDTVCACIQQSLEYTFKLQDQVEGLVVDEENHILFAAVEDGGIYTFNLNRPQNEPVFISQSNEENTNIKYDVEGLALYYLPGGEGYLIASSQGNNSYAVFNRSHPHEYLGSFQVGEGKIDGVSETDGIEVCNLSFGAYYPHGLFICQDGFNKDSTEERAQNFKMVHWDTIANAFNPKLKSDTSYSGKIKK